MEPLVEYKEAIKLSYELWSKRANGDTDTSQEEAINKYGIPANGCWMCEWVRKSGNTCKECVLNGCTRDSLYGKYISNLNHDSKMATIYAEDIRDIFKHELEKL